MASKAKVFTVIHYSKSQVVLLVCAGICFPGRVIQCEFADNLYWENHPQVFLACAVPSSLPEATLQAAYKMREEVAQKLISCGMDNCFFNIEVFGMKDGSVKVKHATFDVISKHTRVCDVIQINEGGNWQIHTSENYASRLLIQFCFSTHSHTISEGLHALDHL